jgi:hypothetical protein
MQSFKFKLRGSTWTVKLLSEKEITKETKEVQSDTVMGYTLFEKLTCYVRNDMHPDQVRTTLYHEICHAILSPLNGSEPDEKNNSVDIESTCNLIGEGLAEIIPQMKKWPASIIPVWMQTKPKK